MEWVLSLYLNYSAYGYGFQVLIYAILKNAVRYSSFIFMEKCGKMKTAEKTGKKVQEKHTWKRI